MRFRPGRWPAGSLNMLLAGPAKVLIVAQADVSDVRWYMMEFRRPPENRWEQEEGGALKIEGMYELWLWLWLWGGGLFASLKRARTLLANGQERRGWRAKVTDDRPRWPFS